jgi:hypothetical protein
MDAPERGALMLVRLIGVLLLVMSVLELGLYWAKCYEPKHRLPVEIIPVVLRLIPALVGFAGLIKAKAIAAWISDKLDL